MRVSRDIVTSVSINSTEKFTVRDFRKHYLLKNKDLVIPSLMLHVLSLNRAYLLTNVPIVELEEKYFYRPDLFAYDYYGDSGLFFIVLYVNDMFSFLDFKALNVKVPSREKVMTVLEQYEPYKISDVIYKDVVI